MNYIGYFETIESYGCVLSDDLEKIKNQWCFATRIFEAPDLTKEEFDKIKSPKYLRIKDKYELIYSDGNLLNKYSEEEINDVKIEIRDNIIDDINK